MAVDFKAIARTSATRMLAWEELQPRQQTYAILRARGFSSGKAAAEIGLSQAAGNQWEQRPWWPAAQERAVDMVATKKGPIVALSARALAALEELLEDGPPKLRAEIAMFVVEQTYGKATSRVQVRGTLAPAEDLDDFLDRLPSIEARTVDE